MTLRCMFVEALPEEHEAQTPMEVVAAVFHDLDPKMGSPLLGVVPVKGQDWHPTTQLLRQGCGKYMGEERADELLDYLGETANGITMNTGPIFEVDTLRDLERMVDGL